jgi:hypothetical protein
MLNLSLEYWEKTRRDHTLFCDVGDAVQRAGQHGTYLNGFDMAFPQF